MVARDKSKIRDLDSKKKKKKPSFESVMRSGLDGLTPAERKRAIKAKEDAERKIRERKRQRPKLADPDIKIPKRKKTKAPDRVGPTLRKGKRKLKRGG